MALSEDERACWDENGYLAIEDVLSPGEVAQFRDALDGLSSRARGLTEH